VAFVLEQEFGLSLPRWLQVELAALVQRASETRGGVLDAAQIRAIFEQHFIVDQEPHRLLGYRLDRNGHDVIEARIGTPDGEQRLHGEGQGAMAAFVDAWTRWSGRNVAVLDYQEHAIGEGTDAEAAAYVRVEIDGRAINGAAIDRDTVAASLRALLSALNRA
jgi:2-isopropylmalate synthase